MMQYSVADRNKITRAILEARKCKTSSEFCFITHDIYELLYPAYALHVEPVFAIEAFNKEKAWVENVVFSQSIIKQFTDIGELEEIATGYRTVLDFLLNDEVCSSIFPFDTVDKYGWKIWKELDKKYTYTKTLLDTYKNARRKKVSR